MKTPLKIFLIILFSLIDLFAFVGGILVTIDNFNEKKITNLLMNILFFFVLFLIVKFQFHFIKNSYKDGNYEK